MSSSQNIASRDHSSDPAPTPQNTPLDNQILKNRPADMGKPTVADIGEGEEEDGEEDVGGFNPASLLAQVCIMSVKGRLVRAEVEWECADRQSGQGTCSSEIFDSFDRLG
jgi:hypothetical protein